MTVIHYDFTNQGSPPESFPTGRAEAAPPLFPPEEMYGLAGDVVRALAPWTEADPAPMYFNFITAFGSAVGRGPCMAIGADRHEPRFYVATVGPTSSGRKGTAWSVIRQVFDLAAPEWLDQHVKSGLSSGEGLIQAMADMKDERHLLAHEPELGRVFTVAGRSGNTVSDQLRQLWDGDRVSLLNRKALYLTGAHLSLIGNITEQELRAKIADLDIWNGFGNRILWVYGERSKLLPSGPTVPPEVLTPLQRDVGRAVRRARAITGLKRTAKAQAYWQEIYLQMADTDPPGKAGAVTERREAQTARLSMAFTVMDGQKLIRPHHVEAAWRAWQYAQASAIYVFGSSSGNQRADRALAALHATPGGSMKRGDIGRHVFSNNLKRDQLNVLRDELVEGGAIVVERQSTSGRAAELWTLT
ncbi:MAG: hypothetical protein QOG15_2053 [Solirubrobacteraceae bacterium]|jgi:hypothetical protein|nr:hypothetical protein [Solirubrobacteraceae bacterium]